MGDRLVRVLVMPDSAWDGRPTGSGTRIYLCNWSSLEDYNVLFCTINHIAIAEKYTVALSMLLVLNSDNACTT
jgi:hypothetical protein